MKQALLIVSLLYIGITYGEAMKYFVGNVADRARENTDYRKELFTTELSQIVLMSIPYGQEIPKEVHDGDQIFVIVEGSGEAYLSDNVVKFKGGDTLVIPAGTSHLIKNIGLQDLKFYTIYAPPQHPIGTIHKTQEDEERSY